MLLYNKGKTFSDISRELQLAGCPVSRQSISVFIKRSKGDQEAPRSVKQRNHKRVLTMEYYEYIDNEMAKNDELCAGGKKVSLIYCIVFNIKLSFSMHHNIVSTTCETNDLYLQIFARCYKGNLV